MSSHVWQWCFSCPGFRRPPRGLCKDEQRPGHVMLRSAMGGHGAAPRTAGTVTNPTLGLQVQVDSLG